MNGLPQADRQYQMCAWCGEPTGRCEEDSLLGEEGEALCEECYDAEQVVLDQLPETGHTGDDSDDDTLRVEMAGALPDGPLPVCRLCLATPETILVGISCTTVGCLFRHKSLSRRDWWRLHGPSERERGLEAAATRAFVHLVALGEGYTKLAAQLNRALYPDETPQGDEDDEA